MKLQSISNDVAQKAWEARKNDEELDISSINIDMIGDDEEELAEHQLEDLVDRLQKVQKKYSDRPSKKQGGEIDSAIPEIVHSELSVLASVNELSQLSFWRWLSNLACDGYFWDFIMWRMNSDQVVNWGITTPGSIIEVYFYRAWLRAYKMYDKSHSDPYKYAKIGSSDVWRSHILRQDFGKDKEFVKAFLDNIHDDDGQMNITTKELRKKLIPALRAWTSGASFSHLTYKESQELIISLRKQGI